MIDLIKGATQLIEDLSEDRATLIFEILNGWDEEMRMAFILAYKTKYIWSKDE